MPYERLVGLNVTDAAIYQTYREAIAPLLVKYGGAFRYDFVVANVLKSEAGHPINRVFALTFKDAASHDGFFSDPEYKAIRVRLFDQSVGGITIIALYERV